MLGWAYCPPPPAQVRMAPLLRNGVDSGDDDGDGNGGGDDDNEQGQLSGAEIS